MFKFACSLLLLATLHTSSAGAAGLCQQLFDSTSRTEMIKLEEQNKISRVHLVKMELSKNTDEAAVELIRLLINGPTYALDEKTVLTKDKMTLGIPLENGFTFLVNFESQSVRSSVFVINDKIILLSPTNKEYKLTDGILSPTDWNLVKSDFDLPEYFDKDYQVNLKIPLSINLEVIEKLKKYSTYFEHIPKEKLRKIFGHKSSAYRNTLLRIGWARSMLATAFIKSPFKIAAQALITAAVINGGGHVIKNYFSTEPLPALNSVQVASMHLNSAAATQLKELRQEGNHRALINIYKKSPDLTDVSANPIVMKYDNEVTWILERKDEDGARRTYIVFTGQPKGASGLPIDDLNIVFEIDAVKYSSLIAQMKQNQREIYTP